MKLDLIALLANWLFVLIYYQYLSRQTSRLPDSSVHTLNARIRERWVDMVMCNDNMEILAVQTLRNSVMAANFMASTSILLIIGTLNLTEKAGQWALDWHLFGLAANFSAELWQLKLSLLLLDFSIAFFCFSMAIRYFNHVGYMINLPSNASPEDGLFKHTCAYLNRAGRYYAFGTRAFFFSLPIILWFFGPLFLTIGTLGLISALATLDKVPH